jgi:1,4-alpha-glucan branching enzyme
VNAVPEGFPAAAPPAADIDRLLAGSHHDPHSVLGVHTVGRAFAARALLPGAKAVTLRAGEQRYPMEPVIDALFAVAVPEHPGDYRLEVEYDGHTVTTDDPYRWLPTVGELDLHLIGEGRHEPAASA